jgi:hypothetical protein
MNNEKSQLSQNPLTPTLPLQGGRELVGAAKPFSTYIPMFKILKLKTQSH